MPTTRKKMALLNGLDRYSPYYSVICVFGSVVGCVVVPLITQSIECIILSAIVISLTAKTIHSRSFSFKDETQDERKRGSRDGHYHEKRTKKKKGLAPSSRLVDVEVVRRQRQEESLRLQEQRNVEKQTKMEGKRLKKARKREEKIKLREEEEREKMREAMQRKEREEKKAIQKQRRPLGTTDAPLIPRERKNSSSSSTSSRSSRSNRSFPRPRPPRMTPHSFFSRASSDSNLPQAPPLPPSPPPSIILPTTPPDLSLPQPSSTQSGANKKSQRTSAVSLSPSPPPHNHNSNNQQHPQTPHRQICAVNPLAPSTSVTTATSLTMPAATTMAIVTKAGFNWNEQMYYWSLDRAGLTRPLQYGWDPVSLPPNYPSFQQVHVPPGNGLHLQVPPQATPLWGSTAAARGPLSAPVGQSTEVTRPPTDPIPSPAMFGVIGNSSPPLTATKNEMCKKTGNSTLNRETKGTSGYSLFSGAQQTLFGNGFLPNGQEGVVAMETAPCDVNESSNEGDSPQMTGGFDKWPAF